MGFIAVILAAVAAFVFGAIWYSILAKPWMEDSRVPLGDNGRPANASSPVPYVTCLIAQIFVAGMLRLMMDKIGITSVANAAQWGAAIGLFFITPWIALNNGYAMRSQRLTIIDGGYATFGCAIMGIVLYLMAPSV